jgi:GATA-binding protein
MGAGMVGTGMGSSSELMGALGDTYAVYNPFPGPYHPDYLSQNWVPPCVGGVGEALPFSGVDSVDGEGSGASSSNASPKTSSATHISGSGAGAAASSASGAGAGANTSNTGRTAKRRRMSTDSVSEPPSSAVSYSSYGDSSFTTGSGATSAGTSSSSRRSSMDFPFFSPYTVFRGNGNNAFWHHSSSGGGVGGSPQAFVHPPMLPDGDTHAHTHGHTHGHGGHGGHGRGGGHGHGMDFLHPPMMLPQEEESLFATYLHPPMILPQEGEQVQHGYEYQGEYYETGSMQQY